jgi:N-acetyl-gamma-glutamyl-phosphate reductase common form
VSAYAAGAVPAIVLGSGYVAGELLRLLAVHPHFRLRAIVSESRAGEPVSASFPHLAPLYPELAFVTGAAGRALVADWPDCAVFGAGAHGSSARAIDELLSAAGAAGTTARVVDVSADFRYRDAADYERVYGRAHGAPARLVEFTCAVPEQQRELPAGQIAHPGCFATAILLGLVPLLADGLIEPLVYVAGVTGSTGAGRAPSAGTHHPQRHANLYAYHPLAHRHAPEVAAIAAAASGVLPEVAFIPHSGPFARGIHVTIQARLEQAMSGEEVRAALARYYDRAPFVSVQADPPQLKDVVTSNHARLSAATLGRMVAVVCVIDNLVKGAAGGAVQWMNRRYGLDEATGLRASAPGWT